LNGGLELFLEMNMLEIVGDVVEMGTLETGIGIAVCDSRRGHIELIGLDVGDIKQMPNMMYKKVRITIEAIESDA
jgi:hypothetical protein